MRSLVKPRPQRAQMITQEEYDVHHWLARLAVVLSHAAAEPGSAAVRQHARKTLDEFCRSSACSETLAAHVKDAR